MLSSVRSSASKLVAKGAELRDAVVPVLTGPVKPAPTFFYCPDGATVFDPFPPDTLYKLAWLHETISQDVPVCLEGTEHWVPFSALEEKLFSKQVVREVAKMRAAREAERKRLAAIARRKRAVRKVVVWALVAVLAFFGLLFLLASGSTYQPATGDTFGPSSSGSTFTHEHANGSYNGGGEGGTYVNGYYRKDGTYVHGYTRSSGGGHRH